MGILDRIKRLEEAVGAEPCEFCGSGSDGPQTFIIGADETTRAASPCPRCRVEPMEFTLTITPPSADIFEEGD